MKKLVLLVDDEDIIRLTSGEILEELGFEVLVASSGKEGLELFKSRQSEVSLVVLDMTLPDIGGFELFQEMKKLPSTAKFLLTSGYSQDMTGADTDAEFIQKPYTIMELNTIIDKLIGNS